MMTNNFALYGVKIFTEAIRDIVFFPFWWYSIGLLMFIKSQMRFLAEQQKTLALFVWIKNIFTPMYGQRDWQGFLISIFMRLIQIFFRSLMMIVYFLISTVLVIFWLALPVLVVFEIVFQIF